jgi:hypothetical protein
MFLVCTLLVFLTIVPPVPAPVPRCSPMIIINKLVEWNSLTSDRPNSARILRRGKSVFSIENHIFIDEKSYLTSKDPSGHSARPALNKNKYPTGMTEDFLFHQLVFPTPFSLMQYMKLFFCLIRRAI